MKAQDLTGRVFGRLTVIERTDSKPNSRKVYWLCNCTCGGTTAADTHHLTSGHTLSCGCYRKERIRIANSKGPNEYLHRDDGVTEIYVDRTYGGGRRTILVDTACYPLVSEHRWSINQNGYAVISRPNFSLKMHRLLLPYSEQVDHRFGNRLDNRLSEIRATNQSQNMRNRRKNRRSTSRYKGVYFLTERNVWRATIKAEGKKHHLGSYVNELEASHAYDEAAREYFGEYACVNHPRPNESDALAGLRQAA